jgi:hypothetical protein
MQLPAVWLCRMRIQECVVERSSIPEASALFHTPFVIQGWLPHYHILELRRALIPIYGYVVQVTTNLKSQEYYSGVPQAYPL